MSIKRRLIGIWTYMICPYGLISIQWIGKFQSGFGIPPDLKKLVITFINNFNQPTQSWISPKFSKDGSGMQPKQSWDQDSYRPVILS